VFAERLPEPIRVAVLDSADTPALDALAQAQPQRVVTVAADLDMPAAILELSRTGNVATPDGQFRVQFTALAQALEKSDLDTAGRRADAAMKIAADNGWTHLVAAVHLAMGGGFLSAAKWPEAISRYTDAGRAARALESTGDEMGSKLLLQAALGRAAVLFAAKDFVKAAGAYEQTTHCADKTRDTLMILECWRMAAYCHEQAGNTANAWECGLRALDAGEALPPERRAQSTLPFAGEGLLRVAPAGSEEAALVERRLTELLGTSDWRSLIQAALARA
jgi:hypothetical protein